MVASAELLFKELIQTQSIFSVAGRFPSYLDRSVLETLQREYSYPPEYGYDTETLARRGTGRAQQLLGLPGAQNSESFLELACSDGMVCWALAEAGKRVTAVDASAARFDERALRAGVPLLEMDAADLQLGSESVDFVFSYNAFEHFASPEGVLREAIRVLRPGGYIYLEFGPLYYSPYGQHAYRSITVPYCQCLFPPDEINGFANRNGLTPIDFTHVNGWLLEQYRELWKKYSSDLQKVTYRESVDLTHLDLISRYPSCFKSKSALFENFIVANISALFKKSEH